MIKFKKILFALFAIAAIGGTTISCKKSDSDKRKKFSSANGTIINAGAVAADGCGWLFDIDGERYHADNFTGAPGLDNKKVVITAEVTEERFRCGWTSAEAPGIPVIHIRYMITL